MIVYKHAGMCFFFFLNFVGIWFQINLSVKFVDNLSVYIQNLDSYTPSPLVLLKCVHYNYCFLPPYLCFPFNKVWNQTQSVSEMLLFYIICTTIYYYFLAELPHKIKPCYIVWGVDVYFSCFLCGFSLVAWHNKLMLSLFAW